MKRLEDFQDIHREFSTSTSYLELIKGEVVVLSSAKAYLDASRLDFHRRFWSKVSGFGDSCWIWQSTISAQGYGIFNLLGKRKLAHRVAYEIVCGTIGRGEMVLHSCDTRPCVNPSHLRAGTHEDNTEDMISRGRAGRKQGRHWEKGINA